MKTRRGFVSNSSSSSFVIASVESDLRDALKPLSLPEGHPLTSVADAVINVFLTAKAVDDNFADDLGYGSVAELNKGNELFISLCGKNTWHCVVCSDGDDDIERFLHEGTFSLVSPDLVIRKLW